MRIPRIGHNLKNSFNYYFKISQSCSSKFKTIFTATGIALHQTNVFESNEKIIRDAKDCMKYACLLNVNSATSLLTTALFAVDTLATHYMEKLTALTSLLDECVLLDGWNEALWENVIALRSDANDLKSELTTLMVQLDAVNKVVSAAIEVTFNLNANNLCSTLCEHSHHTEGKLLEVEKNVKAVEEKYLLALTSVAKYKKPAPENAK